MSDPIEKLFAQYPPSTQAIARKLRTMICSVMPQARESVYHGAVSYALGESVRDRIVYLAMYKDYVRLGFDYGGYLPDPNQVLEGEGKRMRHVKVHTLKEAGQAELKELLRAAGTKGNKHLAEMKQEWREKTAAASARTRQKK